MTDFIGDAVDTGFLIGLKSALSIVERSATTDEARAEILELLQAHEQQNQQEKKQ